MYLINHTTIQLSLLLTGELWQDSPSLSCNRHFIHYSSSNRSRAVTWRGVNSRAKEDLVSGVEQQLERSEPARALLW